MRRYNLDVILVIIVVIFNMGWSLLSIHQPIIGTLLALPLLFVIPGYLLINVLFRERTFSITHQILLYLTVSVCIVLLSGFLLNLLPDGLNARSWSIYLGGLSILLGLLTVLRRRNVVVPNSLARRVRLKLSGYILLGLTSVLIVASLGYSVVSATNQPHPGFTQLWLLPSQEVNNTWQLNLGVRSDELAPATYNVTMSVNHTIFKKWPLVTLHPDQNWNQLVSLPAVNSKNTYVQVQFYRIDNANSAYREVHITLYKQKGAV